MAVACQEYTFSFLPVVSSYLGYENLLVWVQEAMRQWPSTVPSTALDETPFHPVDV